MKRLILILIILFTLNTLKAQYETAVGFRAGVSKGFEFRNFIGPRDALDAWLTYDNGLVITALYEYYTKNHNIKIEIADVAFFVGGGVHARYVLGPTITNNKTEFALDAMIGLEYKLPYIPFILNADIKPFFPLIKANDSNDYGLDYGVSLRYIF